MLVKLNIGNAKIGLNDGSKPDPASKIYRGDSVSVTNRK